MKNMLLVAFALCGYSSLGLAHFGIETESQVNAARFVGTWYRIASNSIIFEPTCACARQVLTPSHDGVVQVYNSCNKDSVSGELVEIRGTATADDSTNSKFSINFGLPWSGSYWIVAVDPKYRWAVVTDSFGYSLYVMSKTPTLSAELYKVALDEAEERNVGVGRLELQEQHGCTYPPAH